MLHISLITTKSGDDPFADTPGGNALTRAIVETMADPFLILDGDLRIIAASRSFYEKFQVSRHNTQGQLLYQIGNGQYNIPALKHFLNDVIPRHQEMKEYKIAHDFMTIGRRVMLLSAREVIYENSRYKHILLTMADITGQEMLDIEKERLSKQKELMLAEMKHRMANSLQLIASILILKSEAVESPEVRTHLKDAHTRIMSIATVEKFLDTTSLNEEVEVGPYLTGLCESLSASIIGKAKPIELKVEAQGGMTTSSEGISLGLITAELVINALKYAFPSSSKTDIIVVSYEVETGGRWRLSVSDNGIGITHDDPLRKPGLGTTIVQSLAQQLHATVEVQSSSHGTTVSVRRLPKTKTEAAELFAA